MRTIIQISEGNVKFFEERGMGVGYLEKKRAQGQATEQRLIDAALTLMRQRGYDAVSIRDICRQAGATTGAFYHHFRSKEEMLERGGRQLDLYIQKQLETRPFHSSLSALRIIFTAYAEYMEQNQGELTARYYQNMLAVSASRPFDEGRTVYQTVRFYMAQAQQKGILADTYSPEETGAFCIRHFRGIVIDWALHNCDFSLMETMEREFKMLYRFFKSSRAPMI